MNGLQGVRVIVVDDKEEEAVPIIKAFARKSVSASLFHVVNTVTFRPLSPRLRGVRLAVLDMDLVEGGASPEAKAATLVNILGRILDPENGPYGVLAWTFHPDIVDHFHHYVFATAALPKPVFTVTVPKVEYQSARTKKIVRLGPLGERLKTELTSTSPLHIFQEWEAASTAAATEVTNRLASLAYPGAGGVQQWRTQWTTDLLRILHALAKARAEKTLDQGTSIESLCAALTPIHGDRLEASHSELIRSLRVHSTQIFDANAGCGPVTKARINTMLHINLRTTRDFAAGNIYAFRSARRPGWAPKPSTFLQPMIKQQQTTLLTDQLLDQISGASIPILVEISASCDHAQKKVLMARLLGGLLVPEIHRPSLKDDSQYLRRLGPLYLEDPLAPPGVYWLYLNAQQVVSLALRKVKALRPFARLRSQALGDSQVWYAQQTSRQGTMLLS